MIVTNNPDIVALQLCRTELVKGTAIEVLARVDQLLDDGWYLVSAPLSANNRLNRSPYRTVILSRVKGWEGDDKKLLEQGINHLVNQGVLTVELVGSADADYRAIDVAHSKTAYQEAQAVNGLLAD